MSVICGTDIWRAFSPPHEDRVFVHPTALPWDGSGGPSALNSKTDRSSSPWRSHGMDIPGLQPCWLCVPPLAEYGSG